MKNLQKFSWGTIEWIRVPSGKDGGKMHIGISTMYPHATQQRHVHFGDEQLLYIISGQGMQRINGEEHRMEPGTLCHIPAGALHESMNDNDEPIVKLLISIPASFEYEFPVTVISRSKGDEPSPRQMADSAPESFGKLPHKTACGGACETETLNRGSRYRLQRVVESLQSAFLSEIRIPFSIWTANHQLVWRNDHYPDCCLNCCDVRGNVLACDLYGETERFTEPYYSDANAYVCKNGLSLYVLPIHHHDTIIGYIKSGHVRSEIQTGQQPVLDIYEVPKSTVNGMLDIMHHSADFIAKNYLYDSMHLSLSKNMEIIESGKKHEQVLLESLRTTQDNVLNSQISNHFLFNTFNCLMSLAIKEGATATCEAIGELSDLLRYTVRTASRFVSFADELAHVQSYVNLQKLRFGKRLDITWRVPQNVHAARVPFNFLQPIIENCFQHAFVSKKGVMELELAIHLCTSRLIATIRDNGQGIAEHALADLNANLAAGSGLGGLAMIARKLASLYGQKYFFAGSNLAGGFQMVVSFPAEPDKVAANELHGGTC